MSFILHHHNGFKGSPYQSFKMRSIDEGNSELTVCNLSSQLKDKVIIGYTEDGLPFHLLVGISSNEDNENLIYSLINEDVVTSIDNYVKNLKNSSDPNHVTSTLIKKIAEKAKDKSIQFMLSLAVNYEKDDKLVCSGFAIGTTGFVRKKGQSEILLIRGSDEWKFGDNLDQLDDVVKLNQFTEEITRGDKLIGCMPLPPDNPDKSLVNNIFRGKKPTLLSSAIIPDQELQNKLSPNTNKQFELYLLEKLSSCIHYRYVSLKRALLNIKMHVDTLVSQGAQYEEIQESLAIVNNLLLAPPQERKEKCAELKVRVSHMPAKPYEGWEEFSSWLLWLGEIMLTISVPVLASSLACALPLGAGLMLGGLAMVGIGYCTHTYWKKQKNQDKELILTYAVKGIEEEDNSSEKNPQWEDVPSLIL